LGNGFRNVCKESSKKLKKKMEKASFEFNKKFSDPAISVPQHFLSFGYRPKIDMSVEYNDAQVTFF
jgi:hypothetical protein